MNAKVINLNQLQNIESAVAEARGILRAGGLVAFPTETVYGLGANIDAPGTMERLCRVKNRPAGKPHTLHIGHKKTVDAYVPKLSLLDRQLLRKAWPGPVTVVFELNSEQQEIISNSMSAQRIGHLYHKHCIGIRLPDHPVAQKLLQQPDCVVVAPSANLSGEPAPTTAEQVFRQLGSSIELILDAGPTRYQKSSTVIKLSNQSMEILREGVLDKSMLQRMRSLNILFVCTGNSCRSPMAEGICKKLIADRVGCPEARLADYGYRIHSCGTMAFEGASASAEAVEACRELGIDISPHRVCPISTELLLQGDYIYVMDYSHSHAVCNLAPQAKARTSLLAGNTPIADPIGMSLAVYKQCANILYKNIRQRLSEVDCFE